RRGRGRAGSRRGSGSKAEIGSPETRSGARGRARARRRAPTQPRARAGRQLARSQIGECGEPRLQVSRRVLSYFPATVETYVATASISAALSCPLNEGITPFPFVTRSTTSAFGGFFSSRFGPTVPVAPASLSVWQLVQPAFSKTALPWATRLAPAVVV